MDAVTYPNEQVTQLLNKEFASVKCNVQEKVPDLLLNFGKIQWTPTFVIADYMKNQIRRIIGYRPPVEFLAELHVSLGLIDLLHTRNREALLQFEGIANRFPRSLVAAESVFWKGIAAYRIAGGNREVLKEHWNQLLTDYPESTWWDRAAVFPGWEPNRP